MPISPDKAWPLRYRTAESIALITVSGTYSVGQITNAARGLAQYIAHAAREQPRLAKVSTPCILIPSSSPASFLVSLMACALAGAVATPWRDRTLPMKTVSDVVRADGVLRLSGIDPQTAEIEILDGPAFKTERPNNLIMMTSGSTGAPKGVALDFAKVALNASTAGASLALWQCSQWAIHIDMALMSALCHMLMAWQFDIPLIHFEGYDLQTLDTVLDDDFGFGGSPVQLIRLHENVPKKSSPKMVVSSGDFLTADMIDMITARHPATQIHKLYGLTELSGRFCLMPHHALMQNKAAAGFPLPGLEARLVNPDDNGIGEIEARSVMMTDGYYVEGGKFEPYGKVWFSTGDRGSIDSNGAITLLGRTEDAFKVGGEKVDRHSIEAALSGLLAGRTYCVLPVEHPLLGQCPALFLAVRDSETTPNWSEIVVHLRKCLPGRFVPSLMYKVSPDLPRLANGKINRIVLMGNHADYERLT